jgi:basic membrane protein A
MKKFVVLGAVALLGLGMAQVRVGMAFDAGGKNDRSFNQSAYEGAMRAAKDFGVRVFDFEPTDPSQVGQGIRKFASEGFDLVIGVGFANEPAITANAKEFKDVAFGVIDSVPGDGKLSNAVGMVFREHEGSFLVGYIAGTRSQTGVVGFVGGMDIPLIHKFFAGYRAGAQYAFKERGIAGKVLEAYTGNTPAAWNDPAKAREIATSYVRQGADVIYAAAGASGLGVINFVKDKKCIRPNELPSGVKFIGNDIFASVTKYSGYSNACPSGSRPIFFIGVDANQNYLGDTDNNPATLNHGLTSMLKRVDVATYETIKAVTQNKFKGGVLEFGLSNSGVGFAIDEYNRALVPTGVVGRVNLLRSMIIDGKLAVPDTK